MGCGRSGTVGFLIIRKVFFVLLLLTFKSKRIAIQRTQRLIHLFTIKLL